MSTDLLRHQDRWKDGVRDTRAIVDTLEVSYFCATTIEYRAQCVMLVVLVLVVVTL